MTELESVYKAICSTKEQYGKYRKTLFHLHTPASHDYRMLSGSSEGFLKQCTVQELVDVCRDRIPFCQAMDMESYSLSEQQLQVYEDKREWLAYLLIAH